MRSEVMLMVRDVQRSSAWYRTLLGATHDHDSPDYDRIIADGQVLLMLHSHEHGAHGMRAPDSAATAGNGVALWLYVDDAKAVMQRAQALEAEIVTELHQNPMAQWMEFTLRDPDGYTIAIAEHPGWPA